MLSDRHTSALLLVEQWWACGEESAQVMHLPVDKTAPVGALQQGAAPDEKAASCSGLPRKGNG